MSKNAFEKYLRGKHQRGKLNEDRVRNCITKLNAKPSVTESCSKVTFHSPWQWIQFSVFIWSAIICSKPFDYTFMKKVYRFHSKSFNFNFISLNLFLDFHSIKSCLNLFSLGNSFTLIPSTAWFYKLILIEFQYTSG